MPNTRDSHTPAFRLLTLGGLSLVDESGAAVCQQRRRLALLALVAGGGERGMSRDRLVALLSPESTSESARHSLQQLLYYVRQLAGEEAFQGTDPLRLNAEIFSSDFSEFEEALDRGDLARAAAVYRGPFLDGFHLNLAEFEEWVATERSRLATKHSDAIRRLAAAAESGGDHLMAVGWWRQLAELDPLSGSVALGLMRALVAAGDASGALRHSRVHEALVHSEVGGHADPEVAAFAAGLARHGPPLLLGATPRLDNPTLAAPTGAVIQTGEPAADGVAIAHAAVTPASQRARRRTLVTGVGVGAALTLTVAAMFFADNVTRPPAPVGLVAVVPFRVIAEDSALTWLREGMVELLTIRLSGAGGMRLMEPGMALRRWQSARRTGGPEPHSSAVRRLASAINAERIIEGSVTGSAHRVVLSASILTMPRAEVAARASAEGSLDSLPMLVDRLAAQLLGISAGVERHRLVAATSASLPAIRSYLEGRAAMRAGRLEEAYPRFRTAVELDSTFALAGLALARAAWKVGSVEQFDRGRRVALAHEDRLSEADRTLLGVTTLNWESAPQMFARWNAVVWTYAEMPEMWYGLGEAYYRWGTLAGIDRFLERAEDAFIRGWELDSAAGALLPVSPSPFVAEPLRFMVELAQLRGDTARVRRLVSQGLAVDSSSNLAVALRWHRAVANGESRDAFWKSLTGGDYFVSGPMFMFTTWTGLAAEDLPLARAEAVRRLRFHDPGILQYVLRSTALNGGRPQEALSAYNYRDVVPRGDLRARVHFALSWGGDTASANEAIQQISRFSDAPLVDGPSRKAHYRDICIVARWRSAHGDWSTAERAVARLRAANFSGLAPADSTLSEHAAVLCAALLDAGRASALELPGSLSKLGLADSLARTWIFQVCCNDGVSDANLLLGKLWERHGDLPRALQAVRRRGGRYMDAPQYLSSFLLEEGRLAALTGDTAGAVRAYRHYLAHRFNPEPSVRPEVERVRREVTALTRARLE